MNLLSKQYWQNNFMYGENRREYNREVSDFSLPLTMPDIRRIWGIDISHWNLPPVDLKRMVKEYSLDFVIIKACDGSLNSRHYPEHVAAAMEAGIPFGMYVWLYSSRNVSIDSQVNAWYARYKINMPTMGLFIDAETTRYGGVVSNPNAADLRSAHDKFKIKSGTSATTYTAKSFADTSLRGFDWSREKLWIANYGAVIPALPIGVNDYAIHQFTATLDGRKLDPTGNFELDGNYVFDEAEFRAKYGGDTPLPSRPLFVTVIDSDGKLYSGELVEQ